MQQVGGRGEHTLVPVAVTGERLCAGCVCACSGSSCAQAAEGRGGQVHPCEVGRESTPLALVWVLWGLRARGALAS